MRAVHRVLIVTAALAFALSGCGASEPEEQVKPEVKSTTKSDPTSTPDPTPTPTSPAIDYDIASYTFDVPESEVERLRALDGVSFESIPVEEAAQVALYYFNQTDFIADAELYAEIIERQDLTSFDRLPAKLAPDNAPQEILAVVSALDRVPWSIPDPADPKLFDRELAHRYIGSMVMSKASDHANKLVLNLSELVEFDNGTTWDARSLAANKFFTTPTVVSSSGTTTNAQGRPAVTITYKTTSGNTYTETFQWVTVGQKGIWLPE